MTTDTGNGTALLRLLAWMSPGFPIGAYTYSHGLEAAVNDDDITDRASAALWIRDCVQSGAGFADTVLLAAAWRAIDTSDADALAHAVETAAALSPTLELALESESQGKAFLTAIEAAWPCAATKSLRDASTETGQPLTLGVAVGGIAAGQGVPLQQTAEAYLHAFAANLISAVVRLVPLGQTDGLRLTAELEPRLPDLAAMAVDTPVNMISTSTFIGDIKSMQHEIQRTRLFRS